MTDKQRIMQGMKRCNNGAEVITKSQIARFMGNKLPTQRVYRLVRDLRQYEGKYYLVDEVAEAYLQTSR